MRATAKKDMRLIWEIRKHLGIHLVKAGKHAAPEMEVAPANQAVKREGAVHA